MLNYVGRRILYSIPVLLIASFLLFAFVRSTFDPTARLRASRDKTVVQRERERLGLEQSAGRPVRDLAEGRRPAATSGESSRSGEEVSSMVSRAMGNTLQLDRVGSACSSAIVAVGIGVYSAVKQYSVGDYAFTGLSYIGIAMPPFWFGLIAIELFAVQTRRVFYSLGLHSGDSSGIDLDYFRHLRPAGGHAVCADRGVVESVPARLDARRAERRLRAHRPGQGCSAAQGDHEARAAQRADPAHHGHVARHRRDCSAA